MLEFTVPWEDWIEEAHKHKKAQFLELAEECRRYGWKAHCKPIEVGCSGFSRQSLHQTLGHLGIREMQEIRAIKNIIEVSNGAQSMV